MFLGTTDVKYKFAANVTGIKRHAIDNHGAISVRTTHIFEMNMPGSYRYCLFFPFLKNN
jgi:hypothetical protein